MISNQAYLFSIFIINGIIIGMLFDIFRILRRSFKTSNMITYIQDVLFWILTGLILLYSIFTFSNGEIRFFMFLGAFLGCLFYMLVFSKYFVKINVKIVLTIKTIVYKIISIIVFPLKILFGFFRNICFKPINFVTINLRNIKEISQKKIKSIAKQPKKQMKT